MYPTCLSEFTIANILKRSNNDNSVWKKKKIGEVYKTQSNACKVMMDATTLPFLL